MASLTAMDQVLAHTSETAFFGNEEMVEFLKEHERLMVWAVDFEFTQERLKRAYLTACEGGSAARACWLRDASENVLRLVADIDAELELSCACPDCE